MAQHYYLKILGAALSPFSCYAVIFSSVSSLPFVEFVGVTKCERAVNVLGNLWLMNIYQHIHKRTKKTSSTEKLEFFSLAWLTKTVIHNFSKRQINESCVNFALHAVWIKQPMLLCLLFTFHQNSRVIVVNSPTITKFLDLCVFLFFYPEP